jgi:hypothetical protein
MTDVESPAAVPLVVLVGDDVAAAQTVLNGLGTKAQFAVGAAVDGNDLVPALETTRPASSLASAFASTTGSGLYLRRST